MNGSRYENVTVATCTSLRARRMSLDTERAYLRWVKCFILYHQKRPPTDMGASDIEDFLTHLAVDREVAASTQNQARSGCSSSTAPCWSATPARSRPSPPPSARATCPSSSPPRKPAPCSMA
ncbi:MAG: hypothetical protein BRD37_01480 [Bacteroidetes bacterium QH_8_67_23]|nr:MAG: hypothetical protein BRD37_01480 [Bacteroidetes bacterium QH_8_67_23]